MCEINGMELKMEHSTTFGPASHLHKTHTIDNPDNILTFTYPFLPGLYQPTSNIKDDWGIEW